MHQRELARQIGYALGGVAVVALVTWWWRRGPVEQPHAPGTLSTSDHAPAGASTAAFATATQRTLGERSLSPRPHLSRQRTSGLDDEGVLDIDDLGVAFLARATDSSLEMNEDDDAAESLIQAGFHVVTPDDSE